MHIITVFALAVPIFATLACCKSNFIRPPERELDAVDDYHKNIRYEVGAKIQVVWETDLDKFDIEINQVDTDVFMKYKQIKRDGSTYPNYWVAQYDFGDLTKNNEDSMYWFGLITPNFATVAESQYVNVSAPKPGETKYVTISTILTPEPTTATTHEPTTTGPFSDEDTNMRPSPSSHSGLSRGETAGVAVGATLAGLLILGGVGWLAWKRLARCKRDTDEPAEIQNTQHKLYSSGAKAELPGDHAAYPLDYARSPPGLHEAP